MNRSGRYRATLIVVVALWAVSAAVALIAAIIVDGEAAWPLAAYITVVTLVYAATGWKMRRDHREADGKDRNR